MNSKLITQNSKLKGLVPRLLDWYSSHARDLPWRRTRDPYAIWVSEIMLQQTQVNTALPYWERWMRELPTVETLAKAGSRKIHKLWEGLGYYTRVRNLQKAARCIVEMHGGKFPESFDEVLALPGIGRYTAGAICSIAFHQPTPILDGNVIRVLTRIFGISGNPREQRTNDMLWRLAECLVVRAARGPKPASRLPRGTARVSSLNQSLMELGALVCTARQPKCGLCPVARHCVAYRQNRVDCLPNLGRRVGSTARRFAVFVVEHHGQFLVRQRPAGVVNAHLWEFPNLELFGANADLPQAARNVLGFEPGALKKLCAIRHSITRYRICAEAFSVGHNLNGHFDKTRPAGRWLTPTQLARLPFPSAHKKILSHLPKGEV